MKHLMNFWMLTAVVALASTACTKYDEVDVAPQSKGKVITFTTEEIGGRTAFGDPAADGKSYPTLWNDGDIVRIGAGVEKSTRTMLKDPETDSSPAVTALNGGKSASFTVEIPAEVEAPYNFFAISPGKMWDSGSDREGGLLRMEIPAAQTATATSCDPMAQLLVATATVEELPDPMILNFKHVAAYGLFSLTGLAAGEQVMEVVLTSSKVISGRIFFDTNKAGDERIDITTSSAGLSKKITVTTSSRDVWFAALPTDLSNTTLKVEVTTNFGTYVKNVTLGSNRKLQSGKIAKFSIDFTGIEPTPATRFYPNTVYYEKGKPVGVVYWVSEDGQTAKIFHIKRTPEPIVWATATTKTGITINRSGLESPVNTQELRDWAKIHPEVEFPMLKYLDELNKEGDSWFWPTRSDLQSIVCLYYNVSGVSSIKKEPKSQLKTNYPELYQATVNYEAFLKEIGADPLDAEDESGNGTSYWSSCEDGGSQSTSYTKAWYYRFGKYNATSATKTSGQTSTSVYYGRAVKIVTIADRDKEMLTGADWSQTTLREGVTLYSASLTLFNRPQKIYVAAIKPSATNQIGIYHAGADTPKQVATQATSADALVAVNGGFFPMAGATPKTGFVKINGVVKEQGDDDLNSTFAGGALVINGTKPGIVKVAGNEAARQLEDENVLVCGPLLMLDGALTTLSTSSDHTTSYAQRTVVGVTKNGTLLLVVVDGRKTDIIGMNGLELQQLMRSLQAKDALNLDGGGSTALWANGAYQYSSTRQVANIVYVK